ncbi:MAG: hypothetical protein AAF517_27700, partial [Planctomycetota bacterium]
PEERGPQIRGFGFLNDGSRGSFLDFLTSGTAAAGRNENHVREALSEFVFVLPTNYAPIVGQQLSLAPDATLAPADRLDLFVERAEISGLYGECDLIAKGVIAGEERGWVYLGGEVFQSDRFAEKTTLPALRSLAADNGATLVFSCVPPGSGERTGVDRDLDGAYDRDELDAGTSPNDASSRPAPDGLFVRGDCNRDSSVDISDPISLLSHLFGVGSSFTPDCRDACDHNDDGRLDISDSVYHLSALFLGGPALEPPSGECGLDPTDDDVECERYGLCP